MRHAQEVQNKQESYDPQLSKTHYGVMGEKCTFSENNFFPLNSQPKLTPEPLWERW